MPMHLFYKFIQLHDRDRIPNMRSLLLARIIENQVVQTPWPIVWFWDLQYYVYLNNSIMLQLSENSIQTTVQKNW